MLFNVRPFSGALFPSVLSPQKDLDALSQVVGPHILLFHDRRGLVLFPPVTGTLWPGIDFGRSLVDFRLFTEDGVLPGERLHLEKFWKEFPKEAGVMADKFVIKTGRIRQITMLGFHVARTSWGVLLIVVPGERPREIDGRLSDCERGVAAPLLEALKTYVDDSDRESLVGTLLSSMPEEFAPMAVFERTLAGPQGALPTSCRLSCRKRGGEWQRDAATLAESDEGERKESRMVGKVVNGEVAIGFSVYVGGVRSLGTLSLPVSKMPEAGLSRLNLFLHDASETLCRKARETVLPEFAYSRHLGRGGFRLEAIEEIAREISPENSREIPVLPLWFGTDHDPAPLLKKLDHVRYTTDILFVDESLRKGCLLLKNTGLEKASFIREKLLRAGAVTIDPPKLLGEYLDNR
ncbi:MAG: hypothetical protein ACYDBP_04705 [Leptospirales bacterium]